MNNSNKILVIFISMFLMMISSVTATVYVATNDSIYKSTDESTFTQVFKLTNFTKYSNVIYPTSYGTPLYLNQSTFVQIAVSEDANKVYGVAYYNSSLAYLIYTNDGGVSWNVHGDTTGAFNKNYSVSLSASTNTGDLKMSYDGQYIYIIMYAFTTVSPYTAGHSYLLRSSDYGATFFATDLGVRTVGSLAVSRTGQYVDIGGGVGAIYVQHSNDYGATYTTSTLETGLSGTIYSTANAISPSGQYHLMIFTYSTGFIRNFVGSNNYGVTWTNDSAFNPVVCTTQPNMIMSDEGKFTFRGSTMIGSPCNAIGTGTNVSHGGSVTYTLSSDENIVGLNDLSKIYSSNGATLYRYLNNNLSVKTNVTSFSSGIVSVGYSPAYVTPVTPVCIDAYTYCTQPINYGGTYVCSNANTQNCAQGCENISGVATCKNTIPSECNIIGASECTSTTQYRICQDINGDNALEWSTGYTCGAGSYCTQQYYASICTTASGVPSVITNNAFTVTPYSITDDATKYGLDASNKIITVNTKLPFHTQQFSTNALNNSYTSRTCKYSESQVYNNKNMVANSSVNITQSFTSVNTQAIVDVNLVVDDAKPARLKVISSLGTKASEYLFIRNSTNKELCIYYGASDLFLTCDTGIQASDDLTSIDVQLIYDFASKQYTTQFKFNRVTTNIITISPTTFVSTDINTVTLQSDSARMTDLNVKTFTAGNGFTATRPLDYNFIPCTYDTKGTYIVRTYNNNNGGIDYTNYYDYIVQVNGLALTSSELQTAESKGFSQTTKYWLGAVFIIVAMALTGGLLGALTKNAGIGALVAFFSAIVVLIALVALGWYPIWIALLLSVVDAIMIAMVFKSIFLTTD